MWQQTLGKAPIDERVTQNRSEFCTYKKRSGCIGEHLLAPFVGPYDLRLVF